MDNNNILFVYDKSIEEYSQLGLGQRKTEKQIEDEREITRESWANIMKQKGLYTQD